MAQTSDPVALTQQLIRCPSITPIDAGALDVLQSYLELFGFTCHRLPFQEEGTEEVDNLYARLGTGAPNLCFAGHTDVVPPGNLEHWSSDPFSAEIIDGIMYGRGTQDMKAAIACFAVASGRFIERNGSDFDGSISFLITGDEEADAINGTVKMLDWLEQQGEKIDACIVGEPTNPAIVGEMIKIGRRGSMNVEITIHGKQGHAAYPHLADNPVPKLIRFISSLIEQPLDQGTEHFPPTTITATSVDVGNETTNIIPATAQGRLNIRFNDLHSGASLTRMIEEKQKQFAGKSDLAIRISGEAFLTPPGPLSDLISNAIKSVTGIETELSTTGGTSDARFIKDYCPVVECGLINETAHKVDENVAVHDIETLTDIYKTILDTYFSKT